MALSNGIQRTRAILGITTIIQARSSAVTITRVTTSTNSLDAETESTTTHTEQLYLHDPSESISDVDAGERQVGDLVALAIADGSVDLQHGDRVTYGGVEYEVDTIVGYPEDGDPGSSSNTDYWDIQFIRRQ